MAPKSTTCPKVRTIIFLDVDGVLNVGARDDGGPLIINKVNIRRAQTVLRTGEGDEVQCAEKIMAVCEHPDGRRDSGGSTLAKLAAGESQISEVLVSRLAALLATTSPQPQVVLASSWRQTRYRPRAEMLRSAIEKKLGYGFQWSGATTLREETTPGDRLSCIGEYVQQLDLPAMTETRVLILDDFFISPFNGWQAEGLSMHTSADAEQFLLRHCHSLGTVSVKIIHPFEEISYGDGQRVQAAVGLTQRHFASAADFLLCGGGATRGPAAMGRRLVASVSAGKLGKANGMRREASAGGREVKEAKTRYGGANVRAHSQKRGKSPGKEAGKLAALPKRLLDSIHQTMPWNRVVVHL